MEGGLDKVLVVIPLRSSTLRTLEALGAYWALRLEEARHKIVHEGPSLATYRPLTVALKPLR